MEALSIRTNSYRIRKGSGLAAKITVLLQKELNRRSYIYRRSTASSVEEKYELYTIFTKGQ